MVWGDGDNRRVLEVLVREAPSLLPDGGCILDALLHVHPVQVRVGKDHPCVRGPYLASVGEIQVCPVDLNRQRWVLVGLLVAYER